MNRTQTIAVTLLVAALPFATSLYAADRGHGDHGGGHSGRSHGHHNDHGGRGHYGHHNHHGYHHGHNHFYYGPGYVPGYFPGNYSYGGPDIQVVLPFPPIPLPPFPVVVLNKKHHGGHIELRRPY